MAVTLIKLGGSLITDKQIAASYREDVVIRLGNEIRESITGDDRQFIIGHGSGSFGHVVAKKYGTISGVKSKEEWIGFAKVATAAKALNNLVIHSLSEANLNIFSIQPSASALASYGSLRSLYLKSIIALLENEIIPVVYGDVAFDDKLGGTIISTENIFTYLVNHLENVDQIILVGSVDGVLNSHDEVIPAITPDSLQSVQKSIGKSYGTDVTGGMISKVNDMLSIVTRHPGLKIRIINGQKKSILKETLMQKSEYGTLISAD